MKMLDVVRLTVFPTFSIWYSEPEKPSLVNVPIKKYLLFIFGTQLFDGSHRIAHMYM